MDTHTATVDDDGSLKVEPGLVVKRRSTGEYYLDDDLLTKVRYTGDFDASTDDKLTLTDVSFDRNLLMIRDEEHVYQPTAVIVHFKVRSDMRNVPETFMRILPHKYDALVKAKRSNWRKSYVFEINSAVHVFVNIGKDEYLFRFIDGELSFSKLDNSPTKPRQSGIRKFISKFFSRRQHHRKSERIIRYVAAC